MTSNCMSLTRRLLLTGAAAAGVSAAMPGPAHAFLPLLLRGLIGGTVGRAAAGRAIMGAGAGRVAGAALQRRTNAHLLGRLAPGASDVVFSSLVDSRYGGLFRDGAEVAVTRFQDREMVSFVSCADEVPVPVVHALQLHVMNYGRQQIEGRFGPVAPFETLYPARLLYASTDFGLARIVYQTLRGQVTIQVAQLGPDAMRADMRVMARAPSGMPINVNFHCTRRRRPMFFE
jgi:hypothetical protein